MNAASLSRSARLQRVMRLLEGGEWHSTLGIINEAQVCAVSALISELRANGVQVECEKRGQIYVYRIAPVGQLSLLEAA